MSEGNGSVAPKQGQHVTYHERHLVHSALVKVVFADRGAAPYVTLCYVRTGAQGETVTKSFIPHESRWTDDFPGFWRMA